MESRAPLVFEADELGAFARICVEISTYSRVAVLKTAYWFTDRCYVYILSSRSAPGVLEVELRLKKEETDKQLETLCREFCNQLLDQQVRQDVLGETKAIREALIEKAFSEGKGFNEIPAINSNEGNVPPLATSFKADPMNIARLTGSDDGGDNKTH
jgi:His-Xaa-Ser system protein HxsD